MLSGDVDPMLSTVFAPHSAPHNVRVDLAMMDASKLLHQRWLTDRDPVSGSTLEAPRELGLC